VGGIVARIDDVHGIKSDQPVPGMS